MAQINIISLTNKYLYSKVWRGEAMQDDTEPMSVLLKSIKTQNR